MRQPFRLFSGVRPHQLRWRHVPSCFGYIHLPDDSRTKLGRRLRKKAAISNGNRIAKSTACFVSSGWRTLAAFPGIAKRFFVTR